MDKIYGRVWVFGDNISTDHIIPGKYLGTTDERVFADHALEVVDPEFSKNVRPGDILVAGRNFGCGSSREQAPVALKTLGISVIVAKSFARIFFRNAINIGLPAVECPELPDVVKAGDQVQVDLVAGVITGPSGEMYMFNPLPEHILEILEAGGLVAKLKAHQGSKRGMARP